MDHNLNAELQQRLAELQEIFHQQLPGKIDEINHSWQQLSSDWCQDELLHLHHLSHSLAGSSGSFGAPEISQSARELERELKALVTLQTAADSIKRELVSKILSRLNTVASTWSPHVIPQMAEEEEPERLSEQDNENLIFIVEDDLLVAKQIEEQLTHSGYQVQHFANPEAFNAACEQITPSVVIMDMVFANSTTNGADTLNKIKEAGQEPINTIVISVRSDIEARLAALRAGAQHYLIKPVDLGEILHCVNDLTKRLDSQPYRVLIVDDDDTLAQYHSELLESHGIETRIINNPLMALEIIDQYQPELVLLDIYMTGCSGTELAAVIRQDDRLAHMSIIFLSEELDLSYQLSALHLGADDFINKPVNPDHFIEKLRARLQKTRSMAGLNRKLYMAVRELECQQRAIDAHNIVSITNTSGTITYANNKFCEVSQYPREELLGRNHRIIKSSHHSKSFYDQMWATISAGKVWHGVIQNQAKDGSSYWVDSTIVPFLDKQGMPYKYVSIRTNITPVIEVQRELTVAKEEAEEASRAKSSFLSNMSHELRTPMNAILGFTQLLEMEEINSEQQSWIKEIMKGGNHLLTLINDVLDLSKIESGHIDLSLEAVSIHEVVNEASTLLAPLLQSRQVKVTIEACEKAVIHADRTRIKQVVLNLLSNAIKYNCQNGSIHISCSRGGHDPSVRLSIRDTGPGIPQEKLSELFEPFNRLGAEGSNIEGSGIGLSICKKLTTIMGGEIGVDSEPGHGSTFWIELCEGQLPPQSTDNESKSTKEGTSNNRIFDVLYIEDNPVNLRLVSMVMSKRPHIRLQTAHEPILGLEMSKNNTPDLILLDINLPEIDGYEVLKRLKADPKTANIPVIAVSANALDSDLKKGEEAGFDDYVTKPINIKHFMQTVDDTLQGTK